MSTLPALRRNRILADVLRAGGMTVTALAHQLGVAHTTVRRDLDALDRAGRLCRVHGGAVTNEVASAARLAGARDSELRVT